MKILVIFTGGTIGSSTSEGGYTSPESKNNFLLIENYRASHKGEVCFDCSSPLSMLSENLSFAELNAMADELQKNLDKGYDGIIITHGTDTLQYTGAALGYLFADIKIPVILVSSGYPLSHPRQNGDDNFAAAVAFIREKAGNGVFISYRNPGCEQTHIHLAVRALSHLETTDSLYSLDGMYYASYSSDKIKLNDGFVPYSVTKGTSNNHCCFCKDSSVLVINSLPGDCFSYGIEGKKAVLIRSYHSGTANTESESFKAFCTKAKEMGIPLFLTRSGLETVYESTRQLEALGVSYLPHMTFVAAYIKLWLGVSVGAELLSFMYRPMCGEFM